MKNMRITVGLVIILTMILYSECKKEVSLPELTTTDIVELTPFSATTGGNIISDGNSDITARGICWIDTPDRNPKITDNITSDGQGTGIFISHLINLLPGTTYNVRSYATNSEGTEYGEVISFTTLVTTPLISDMMFYASDITTSSAKLHGLVNPMSLNTAITFEYGLTTAYEKSIPSTPNNISLGGYWGLTGDITELIPGSEYHFRIKAENALGITYSNDKTFTTEGWQPIITNISFKDVTLNSVTILAIVNPGLIPTSVVIEYGTSTSLDNSATISQTPLNGGSDIDMSATIDNLSIGTKYYFRIKAYNQTFVTHSNEFNFTTYGVADVDGNFYHAIIIGSQEWLQENLKTTHFQNGDPINLMPYDDDWKSATESAYIYYNYDLDIGKKYGYLYNFYAASDPRSVCPYGWHVPSLTEWRTLVDFAGGENVAPTKLREPGTAEWSYNTNADNSTGFTALGGGIRLSYGPYWGYQGSATFWSTTSFASDTQYKYAMRMSSYIVEWQTDSKTAGFSIRCLKN